MALLVTAVLVATALFSSLAFGANPKPSMNYVNVARLGNAWQSSTHSGSCNPTADKAIDGNTEGVFSPWCSVTQTNSEPNAWWQLQLPGSYIVHAVILFNRVDSDMDRLSNFDVILKDESNKVVQSFHEVEGGIEILAYPMISNAAYVRYVRVQLRGTGILSLAEVHVYGEVKDHERNLAAFRPATQSSTKNDPCQPTASVAVDANTEGVFSPWCSVTQTNNEDKAWWEVDLQHSTDVHEVHVFNRVDCCMQRLDNFNVTLKDSDGDVLATENFPGGTDTQEYTYEVDAQSIIISNVRYVRVHLLGTGILSLAEVQVYGWY